jgi:hypothetical protein
VSFESQGHRFFSISRFVNFSRECLSLNRDEAKNHKNT